MEQEHQNFTPETVEFALSKNQTKWPIKLWTLKQEMETTNDYFWCLLAFEHFAKTTKRSSRHFFVTWLSWSRKQLVANWLLGLVSGQGHISHPPPRPLWDDDNDDDIDAGDGDMMMAEKDKIWHSLPRSPIFPRAISTFPDHHDVDHLYIPLVHSSCLGLQVPPSIE